MAIYVRDMFTDLVANLQDFLAVDACFSYLRAISF